MDLRTDDVWESLQDAGHEVARPTLFLAEHLLVFLEQSCVEDLLRELSDRASADSRLAVTLEVHREGLSSVEVVDAFNAHFFGSIKPMPTILSRLDYLALLSAAGWKVSDPALINKVRHTEDIDTQFVTATPLLP